MCRDKNHGGRRCPLSGHAVQANRDAQKRLYLRRKARSRADALAGDGILALDDLAVPTTYHYGDRIDLSRFGGITDDPSSTNSKPGGALWSSPGAVLGDGVVTPWVDEARWAGLPPDVGRQVRPEPGQVLRVDGERDPVEVLGYSPLYDGEYHQVTYLTVDGDQCDLDFLDGDIGFTHVPPGQAPTEVGEGYAEQWKADNGSGFVAHANRVAQGIVAGNSGRLTDTDLATARLMRAVAAADPEDTVLHRGLFVARREQDEFLDAVRGDGYRLGVGSFTPDAATARDFALGVDTRPEFRNPGDAVLIETVGPTRAVDLWPGSDEPEQVSGGTFGYVSHHRDPDGTLHVQVRQTFTPTPETPTLSSVPLPHRAMFPITPAPGALVVRADTADHFRALAARYPDGAGGVSFAAMAADGIDGLWVDGDGLRTAKASGADPVAKRFYSWDVESVAWLRPERLRVGEPVPVSSSSHLEVEQDDWDRWDDD